MKRTALRRYTPIRARRNKPERREGKLGIVRLSGEAMEQLREECFQRDRGICHRCGNLVYYYDRRYVGDPLAYDMAHIRSRGASGSDSLENVKTMHHCCHMAEHSKGKLPHTKGLRG